MWLTIDILLQDDGITSAVTVNNILGSELLFSIKTYLF
jgi:hypothetical protein